MIFLHCIFFAIFSEKQCKPHKRRSRTASTTHDYPASFYCTLSDQTRTLIIIIIIIYPEILGAHLRTHAYTPGHIYPGKTRTRFCYPCPGAPARDHGAGRITPLGKFGFSSKCTKKSACTCAVCITDRASANGARRINRWHFLGCQRCRACRFYWPGLPAEKLDHDFFGLVDRHDSCHRRRGRPW